jgi:hypothetical protein
VDIDVEINRKISSAKVSEKAPFRAKSCREICNALQPTKNEIAQKKSMNRHTNIMHVTVAPKITRNPTSETLLQLIHIYLF